MHIRKAASQQQLTMLISNSLLSQYSNQILRSVFYVLCFFLQFQGPMGMPVRGPGPGPDWRRPQMHGGFPPQGPPQGPPHMQGPPRPQMGPGPPPGSGGPHGAPAPHVNPAFFNQPGGPPPHPGMGGPPHGQPGPQPGMNMPPQHGPPPHFAQQGGPRNPWPGPPQGKPPGAFPDPQMGPQLTEVEFEEVMSRNRTVSSSAIAR